jgi:hypothetical protein
VIIYDRAGVLVEMPVFCPHLFLQNDEMSDRHKMLRPCFGGKTELLRQRRFDEL